MTEITDPEKVKARALAVSEQLHLIADAIAEGTLKNFDFAAREDNRSVLRDVRGNRYASDASIMTVSFVLREPAQSFYEDQKQRKRDLDEMIASLANINSIPAMDEGLLTGKES